MKKILAVYYTQTGQLKEILDSLLRPLTEDAEVAVDYLEIQPAVPYPFPWRRSEFLDVFPETVLETPSPLKPLAVTPSATYDLVLLAFQPWYLSPSPPMTAFLQSKEAKTLIRGADVVTVIGARNMWVQSHERIGGRVADLGGRLRGNIALVDRAPNLVSAVTIGYWMFTGKKDRWLGIFPAPGVSHADIAAAARYGEALRAALTGGNLEGLGETLKAMGGDAPNPTLARLEKRAKKVFRLWAGAIVKRPHIRRRLLNIFFAELVLALAIVSPVNSLLGLLKRPRGRA